MPPDMQYEFKSIADDEETESKDTYVARRVLAFSKTSGTVYVDNTITVKDKDAHRVPNDVTQQVLRAHEDADLNDLEVSVTPF